MLLLGMHLTIYTYAGVPDPTMYIHAFGWSLYIRATHSI
jgi:hypothetical protein